MPGVPPPPPPPPPEDEPPQAVRKIRLENIRQPNRKPQSFFRREVKPAPSSASPPTGSHMAKKTPADLGASEAVVAAVVFTVSVEVPELFATDVGLSEHVGARAGAGVTAQVKLTAPLKPFSGATVMVEVEAVPAETVAGVSGVGLRVKSPGKAAVTVRLSGAVA